MRNTIYQFEHFVVDAGTRRFSSKGRRQPLQEQPFRVLLALLEQPGKIVTRETLRLRLWGTHTFVDFDQSLNSAVRRLRLALDDNPRTPAYVVTIPRIGFRFLPVVAVEHYPTDTRGNAPGEAARGFALAT